MHAEDLVVDDRRQRQKVKHFCTIFPDVDAPVLPLALVVEAVDLRDLPRLVVASY